MTTLKVSKRITLTPRNLPLCQTWRWDAGFLSNFCSCHFWNTKEPICRDANKDMSEGVSLGHSCNIHVDVLKDLHHLRDDSYWPVNQWKPKTAIPKLALNFKYYRSHAALMSSNWSNVSQNSKIKQLEWCCNQN